MISLQQWQEQHPLLQGRRLMLLIGVLGAALALGLIAANQPIYALGIVVVAILTIAILAWPEVSTLIVIAILYSNAAVVAVRYHGVPEFIGASTPVLLMIPLASYLVFRRQKLIITPTLPLIFLFLVIQVVGTVFAEYTGAAITALTSFLVEGIGLYFLITNVIRTPAMLRRVTWLLIIIGAILGGLSFYQDVTQTYKNNYLGFAQISNTAFHTGAETINGEVDQRRLAGPLGDQNRYAQIMLMLVPLALFRFLGERSTLLRLLAVVITALIALGVALTFSRGAAVGFVLVLVIMMFMRYIKPWQLGLLILGVIVLLEVVPEYRTRLVTIETVSSLTSEERGASADGSIRSRVTEGLAALLVFVDHPLVGVGPGVFRYYYQDYAEIVGLRVQAADRQAHNLYLGMAAENGSLGIGCFLALVVTTMRGLAKTRRQLMQSQPELSFIATGFLLAIAAYLLTGIFLHFAYIRYFWLMLALADAVTYITMNQAPATTSSEPASQALAAAPAKAIAQGR
jgi:putative inorganic carbon (hco3(-)) transporter